MDSNTQKGRDDNHTPSASRTYDSIKQEMSLIILNMAKDIN